MSKMVHITKTKLDWDRLQELAHLYKFVIPYKEVQLSEPERLCEYLIYKELGYPEWECKVTGGDVDVAFCQKVCRYCPQREAPQ